MSTVLTDDQHQDQSSSSKKRHMEDPAQTGNESCLQFPESVHDLETLFKHVEAFHHMKMTAQLQLAEARRLEQEVILEVERTTMERLKLELQVNHY